MRFPKARTKPHPKPRLASNAACPYLRAIMAEPPIVSWEGLGLQQGGGWLFGAPPSDGLDLHVGPRDRLALIGRNLTNEHYLLVTSPRPLAAAGELGLHESLRGLYPDMHREFATFMRTEYPRWYQDIPLGRLPGESSGIGRNRQS